MSVLRTLCSDFVTVGKDVSTGDAARLMSEKKIGSLVIVEGDALVGIFTERDLMNKVVSEKKDPETTLVKDVMTTSLVTAEVEDSILEVLEKMGEHHIRHLPLLNGEQKPVGMLTMRQLHNHHLQELQQENEVLTALIVTDGPGG